MGNQADSSLQWEMQRRTVVALCALRKWGDHFDYAASDELYVRLRVRGNVDDKHLAIQFPRSPAMTPHYKAIRDWFEDHRVDWKDRTHDGERFMTARVPLDPEWVHGLLEEAGRTVFGANALQTIIRTPLLYIEYVIARRPRLWFACLALLPLVMLCFWLYEFAGAQTLLPPALSNLSAAEMVFVVLEGGLVFILKTLLHRPILSVRVQRALKVWGVRAFLFVPPVLAILTG